MVNSVTIARESGLVAEDKSLWDSQWDLLSSMVSSETPKVHYATKVASRGTCRHCGGRMLFECAACGVPLHSSEYFKEWHAACQSSH